MRFNKVSLLKDVLNLIPPRLIEQLKKRGKIYLVGGALRDHVLYKKFPYPELDFVVEGVRKNELLAQLRKYGSAKYVGKSFRVVKFYTDEDAYTVHDFSLPVLHQTTLQEKVRNPDEVPLREDLASRDFSINSLAFDLGTQELIDYFGGLKDIEGKVIRAIRDNAFEKDPIRVLRAIRFSTQLGFGIESGTLDIMSSMKKSVNDLVPERIRDELVKIILRCESPGQAFRQMEELGILELLLPELHDCYGVTQPGGRHDHDVFEHTLKTLDYAPRDLVIRLAALFHDVGKPPKRFVPEDGRARFYGHQELSARIAKKRLRELKFSNKIIKQVSILILRHMFTHKVTPKGVRRLIRRVGEDLIPALFQLRYADMKAQNLGLSLEEDQAFEKAVMDEIKRKPPITISDLDIDGNVIMEAFDLEPGKQIGKIHEYLIEKVMENPELNKREKLLELVKIFLD